MGIKLNWDDQSDQALDAIEIYRSLSPIDENSPGTPIATLPGTARSYDDGDVLNGNVYYYRVAVKKGSNRSFGAQQTQGYFANLGPGPQKVIRGDWIRGYFGEIANADWVTPTDVVDKIKAQLRSLTGLTFATNSPTWYKFIYKGKILFFPSNNLITSGNWQQAYNAGFIYGVDGFGTTPSGAAGAVNQKVVIEIGGYQFLVRAVRLSDKPTTQYLTAAADFNDCEWKGTFARLRADANVMTDPTIQPRFSDAVSIPASACAHLADASSVAVVNTAAPETLAKTALTASLSWMVLLELIP